MTDRKTPWTPGPWTRGNAHHCGKDLAICAGHQVLARVVGFGYPIGEGFHAESEANARLFIAADEMADLLGEFIRALDQWTATEAVSARIREVTDEARALLARIGGGN